VTETPADTAPGKPPKPPKLQRGPKETLLLARSHILRTALALAVLAPLAIAGGVFGVRTGRLSYQTGYQLLCMGVAPVLATLALLLGALGLLSVLLIAPRKGMVMGLVSVALGGLVMFGVTQHRLGAAEHPPIHDVATDWRDPILFSPKLVALRGDKANPVELAPVVPEGPRGGFLGQPVAMINAQTCPAATPIVLQSDLPFAYARARRAVNNFGWTIVTDDRDAGTLEATARSLWLNLPYDVAVRVRQEGAGARVDIRAIARYGQADRGADCLLVTRLRKAME
jgi:fatty-acyl-CoA synthase